jgi:hypothetical protein
MEVIKEKPPLAAFVCPCAESDETKTPRPAPASERVAEVNLHSGFGSRSGFWLFLGRGGAKHGAPHPTRPKKGLPPSRVPPPSCFSTLPALLHFPRARSPGRTGLWRAQGSAPDLRAARNIPSLARITGVDSGCTPGHRRSRQRESCGYLGAHPCYPSLTLVADKEQIFC